jgi:hypothetical protein
MEGLTGDTRRRPPDGSRSSHRTARKREGGREEGGRGRAAAARKERGAGVVGWALGLLPAALQVTLLMCERSAGASDCHGKRAHWQPDTEAGPCTGRLRNGLARAADFVGFSFFLFFSFFSFLEL